MHVMMCSGDLVSNACVTTSLPMGDFVPNIRSGTDTYSIREPLGICAGICPSNFPGMVPLWMFPISVTCGNTFILKASERDSAACLTSAELGTEAGLPNGVLNVIHGTNVSFTFSFFVFERLVTFTSLLADFINAICDSDEIKAVSFVSPDTVGMYVNARASANGKRVQDRGARQSVQLFSLEAQSHGGKVQYKARMHSLERKGFLLNKAAGWKWKKIRFDSRKDKLVNRTKALKVGAGIEPDVDIGPVISKQAKEKICKLIRIGVDCGARLVLWEADYGTLSSLLYQLCFLLLADCLDVLIRQYI
ncbi:methylmalonate-semialdehyde dehydrogenase [acylating], mitochondrial-like [Apium graveolens]|uniref:methylmalonate-semialdehyde dehydrogenase [acylating], mitochondrial-like n=1 Tax=Apium graveolens TaxID=4045 RepID=UPI003D79A720